MLQVINLSKSYLSGKNSLKVLDNIDFNVPQGEVLAIVGPSGSGKTTLLGLCAGLDGFSEGSVLLNNIQLENLSEEERASIRSKYIGFIFQNFQLIPTLTALENVMVPMELQRQSNVEQKAIQLLEKVGLGKRIHHYPTQLSGGEQQRVAVARAFMNNPQVLFADEPTGNLDRETGQLIQDLLFGLNKENGTTLILVTHDPDLAAKATRQIHLSGGKIVSDYMN